MKNEMVMWNYTFVQKKMKDEFGQKFRLREGLGMCNKYWCD